MSLEIKNRRLQWLGHIRSMPNERIPKVPLRWTLTARKKRGIEAKDYLTEDGDEETEGGGSLVGQITGQSTGQGTNPKKIR